MFSEQEHCFNAQGSHVLHAALSRSLLVFGDLAVDTSMLPIGARYMYIVPGLNS